MQKIAVSILHYNNIKDTYDCLDTMMDLDVDGIALDTYVLDNGSFESIIIDVSKYKKLNLTLIRSSENLGFTGGHNFLYKKAISKNFDYFLILNNDILLEKKSIRTLVESINSAKIGAVVPKIYFTKGCEYHKDRYKKEELGKVIWFAGGRIDWDNVTSKHIGVDEVDVGQFDKKQQVSFATGACLLLKHEVIKKVGLFDDKYFLYYEDADLSTRIIRMGYTLIYEPKAIVWHNNAGSSGVGSNLHDYYLSRNKMVFGMKHAPLIIKVHLLKEAMRLLVAGRTWQRRGIRDYFLNNLGKGSYGK